MVTFTRIFFLFLVVFLPLQLIPLPDQIRAQEGNTGQNPVKLTVFFLSEKEACRKSGYADYNSERKTKCEELTRKDVERWVKLGKPHASIIIPAGQRPPVDVPLGAKCFDIVQTYPSSPGRDPAKRKAVVMAFEWDQPQYGDISLERKDIREPVRIPLDTWDGNLTGENMWISNSRVDGFFPRSNVEWTLRLGGEKWIFVFKAKE
jgi:hypothetical protein